MKEVIDSERMEKNPGSIAQERRQALVELEGSAWRSLEEGEDVGEGRYEVRFQDGRRCEYDPVQVSVRVAQEIPDVADIEKYTPQWRLLGEGVAPDKAGKMREGSIYVTAELEPVLKARGRDADFKRRGEWNCLRLGGMLYVLEPLDPEEIQRTSLRAGLDELEREGVNLGNIVVLGFVRDTDQPTSLIERNPNVAKKGSILGELKQHSEQLKEMGFEVLLVATQDDGRRRRVYQGMGAFPIEKEEDGYLAFDIRGDNFLKR